MTRNSLIRDSRGGLKMDSESIGFWACFLPLVGAFVAIGFGVYFFIKGDVTNGLLALILSCLAFNLVVQLNET